MTDTRPACDHEDHPNRPAVVEVTWPDDRHEPMFACRPCVERLVHRAIYDGHPILITPLETRRA